MYLLLMLDILWSVVDTGSKTTQPPKIWSYFFRAGDQHMDREHPAGNDHPRGVLPGSSLTRRTH